MEKSTELILFFLNELKAGKLKEQDIDFLFSTNPLFKEFFLTTIFSLPIEKIEGSNNINKCTLELPAINLLMSLAVFQGLSDKVLSIFKDKIDPFKEVYLKQGNDKYLVHGLDVYSLLKSEIFNKIKEVPLHIKNLNQFYMFLNNTCNKTTQSGEAYNSFKLLTWQYKKTILFDINYEDLFIKEIIKSNQQIKIILNLEDYQFKFLNKELAVSLGERIKPTKNELAELITLCNYKILNNEINFEWDEKKIIELLITPNSIFYEKNQMNNLIKMILKNAPESLSQDVMTTIYLKDKEIYSTCLNLISQNNIPMKDNKMENETTFLPNNINSWNEYIKSINELIEPKKETDKEVIKVWEELKIQFNFLLESKQNNYFSNNLEDKFLLEQILSNYIVRILTSYFDIPEHLRIAPENGYLELTISQLKKIQQQLTKFEVAILEDNMKNIRVFNNFLENRLVGEDKSIIKLSK